MGEEGGGGHISGILTGGSSVHVPSWEGGERVSRQASYRGLQNVCNSEAELW